MFEKNKLVNKMKIEGKEKVEKRINTNNKVLLRMKDGEDE